MYKLFITGFTEYNYHDNKQIEYFANITLQRGVLMTCGSDFHGKNKPLIHMGKFAPSGRYESYLTRSINAILENRA